MARKKKEQPLDLAGAQHQLSPGHHATAAALGDPHAELPPAPEAPPIVSIALRDLGPSPHQTRRFRENDPELQELARSIRAKGVVAPVLVRPSGDGRYNLIFGERRYRASCLQGADLDDVGPAPLYIPAMIRDCSDEEAAELTTLENLQRADLDPFEEAASIGTLLILYRGDQRAIASKIGKPVSWVACRARIHTHLTDAWKQAILQPDSVLWSWTAAHLDEIAKLDPEVQNEVLSSYSYRGAGTVTVEGLRRDLAEMFLDLKRAPFDLDDETLNPSIGACSSCPSNTLSSPYLFDDNPPPVDVKEARCLNRPCYMGKCQASVARRESQLRESHPDLVIVRAKHDRSDQIPPELNQVALRPYEYDKVSKGTKGAVPAMIVDDTRRAGVIWIAPKNSASSASIKPKADDNTPSAPSSLEDRRQKHLNRRASRMAELTRERLKTTAAPTKDLLALALVFGTLKNCRDTWNRPWGIFEAVRSSDTLAQDLWHAQIVPVLSNRLQYLGPQDTARLLNEIHSTLALVGASYDDLYREVARAIPEPKSWAKVQGYIAEDLTQPAPLPVDPKAGVAATSFADEDPEEGCGADEEPPFEINEIMLPEDFSDSPEGDDRLMVA